jgi:hypothetical protein
MDQHAAKFNTLKLFMLAARLFEELFSRAPLKLVRKQQAIGQPPPPHSRESRRAAARPLSIFTRDHGQAYEQQDYLRTIASGGSEQPGR